MASVTNIASWSQADYQSATAAQIASLTTAQVGSMAHADWLLPAAIAGFTAEQVPFITTGWNWMGAAWLNALSPAAFAAIPAMATAGAIKFSSTALAGLDATHAAALTTAQLAVLGSPQSLSATAVSSLSAAQLVAIPAAKWGSMGAAWLNAVSPTLFATIAGASVAKFSNAAVAGLDLPHVAALTTTQMAAMANPQSLSLAAVATLTPAQASAITTDLYWMSASWLNALSPATFAALTPAQTARIFQTAMSGLDAAHVGVLTGAQLKTMWCLDMLNPSAIAALNPTQVAALSVDFWYWAKPAWINSMSVGTFASLSAPAIAKMTSATVSGLDLAHVLALTPTQLDAMAVGGLTTASVAALTAAQLTGMGAATWGGFTAAQLNAMPLDKFAMVPTASVAKFSRDAVTGLDVPHTQALTVAQMAAVPYLESLNLASVAALSPQQVAAVTSTFYWMSPAWLNALTPAAFAAIPPAGMAQMAQIAIGGLDVAHVKAMTPAQFNAIWCKDALSPASIAALSPAQLAGVTNLDTWYWAAPAWFNAMSAEGLASLSTAAIAKIQSGTLAQFDAAHIGALTATQVGALGYWQRQALTAAQLGAFSASAMAGFSVAQLGELSTTQVAGLTATQIAGLSTTQVASLSFAKLGALSVSAASAFNPAQLAALGTNIGALAPATIAGLSVGTVQSMSFMQVSNLKPAQIAAMTQAQLGALSAVQVNYLTAGQLAALDGHAQWLSASAVTGLNNVHLISVYASLSATQLAALTTAQKAAVAQAGTAVTGLLQTLAAGSVRTQVEAVLNSGESLFSHESLLKVLQGVDASIGSGSLTQAQMTDLKALVTAVGQSVGTDSYLYEIASNVVNGNKSNAMWTGGLNTSTVLGNLAVGSSAGQLDKLIGKWFLGTDLPTYVGATYATVDAPLFSAAGPLASDVQQRGIGDCYMLAALVDVADDYSALLESMFTDNGNGTWGVRLYGAGDDPLYVTVSNVLPTGWTAAVSATGGLWVSLIEKAYVEWEVQTYGEANNYASINGGYASGMSAIAGRDSVYYSCNSYTLQSWTTTVKSTVLDAMARGEEVMYSSFQTLVDTDNGKTDLVNAHQFAVLGYDGAKDELILRNPWGHAGDTGWNGVFDLTFDQLYASGCSLLVTKEGAPTGAIDTKYTVNASVDQLLQAMASDTGSGGASTSLLGANSIDNTRLALVAPTV